MPVVAALAVPEHSAFVDLIPAIAGHAASCAAIVGSGCPAIALRISAWLQDFIHENLDYL